VTVLHCDQTVCRRVMKCCMMIMSKREITPPDVFHTFERKERNAMGQVGPEIGSSCTMQVHDTARYLSQNDEILYGDRDPENKLLDRRFRRSSRGGKGALDMVLHTWGQNSSKMGKFARHCSRSTKMRRASIAKSPWTHCVQ